MQQRNKLALEPNVTGQQGSHRGENRDREDKFRLRIVFLWSAKFLDGDNDSLTYLRVPKSRVFEAAMPAGCCEGLPQKQGLLLRGLKEEAAPASTGYLRLERDWTASREQCGSNETFVGDRADALCPTDSRQD